MDQQQSCAAEEQIGSEDGFEVVATETAGFPLKLPDQIEEPVETLEVHGKQCGKDGISFEIITAEATSKSQVPSRWLQSDKQHSIVDVAQKLSDVENRRRRHIEDVRAKAHDSNLKVELVTQRNVDNKSKLLNRLQYNSMTRQQECADRRSHYLRNNSGKMRSEAPMEQQNTKMQLKKEMMEMCNTKAAQIEEVTRLMKRCALSADGEKSSCSKQPNVTLEEKSCERETKEEAEDIKEHLEGGTQDDKGHQLN